MFASEVDMTKAGPPSSTGNDLAFFRMLSGGVLWYAGGLVIVAWAWKKKVKLRLIVADIEVAVPLILCIDRGSGHHLGKLLVMLGLGVQKSKYHWPPWGSAKV